MALPATGVSFSAINAELGNASTSARSLNDLRVRSLSTSTAAEWNGRGTTNNSQISFSDLASKSASFATHKSEAAQDGGGQFTSDIQGVFDIHRTNGSLYHVKRTVNDPTRTQGPTATNQAMAIMRRSLNGFTIQTSATRPVMPANNQILPVALNPTGIDIAEGPARGVITYTFRLAGAATNNNRFGVASVNDAGTVLAALDFTTAFTGGSNFGTHRNICTDRSANGHAYVAARMNIVVDNPNAPQVMPVLASFTSDTLALRWIRRVDNPQFALNTILPLSTSDTHITCAVSGDSGNVVTYIRFDLNGGVLASAQYTFAVDGATYAYETSYANRSGAGVHALRYVTGPGMQRPCFAYFNSAGAIQWMRIIDDPNLGVGQINPGGLGAVAEDGSAYCFAFAPSAAGGRIIFLKFNSAGTLQWQRTLRIRDPRAMPPFNEGYSWFNATGSATKCIIHGEAEGLITFRAEGYYTDEYGTPSGPPKVVLFTLKTDGSGTGTVGDASLVVTYETSSFLVTAAGTFTNQTVRPIFTVPIPSPSSTPITLQNFPTFNDQESGLEAKLSIP